MMVPSQRHLVDCLNIVPIDTIQRRSQRRSTELPTLFTAIQEPIPQAPAPFRNSLATLSSKSPLALEFPDMDFTPPPTGTWPSLRVRRPETATTVIPSFAGVNTGSKTSALVDIGSHTLTSYGRKRTPVPQFTHSHPDLSHKHASEAHSESDNPSSPPSSSASSASPVPVNQRQVLKKLPLACLFCRGRKIACGPPIPGSKDNTCK